MLIIHSKTMAKEKVKKIQLGYSAFAETKEVTELMKKELDSLGIEVIIDATDKGSWFIPKAIVSEK